MVSMFSRVLAASGVFLVSGVFLSGPARAEIPCDLGLWRSAVSRCKGNQQCISNIYIQSSGSPGSFLQCKADEFSRITGKKTTVQDMFDAFNSIKHSTRGSDGEFYTPPGVGVGVGESLDGNLSSPVRIWEQYGVRESTYNIGVNFFKQECEEGNGSCSDELIYGKNLIWNTIKMEDGRTAGDTMRQFDESQGFGQ